MPPPLPGDDPQACTVEGNGEGEGVHVLLPPSLYTAAAAAASVVAVLCISNPHAASHNHVRTHC